MLSGDRLFSRVSPALNLAAPSPFAYTYPMDITQISDGEDWLIQRLTSILQDDAIQDLYVHQVIGALEMMKIQ